MRGECVASWVNVDGRVKGPDANSFLNAPPDPVLLRGKDGNIFFSKVVLVISGMMQHS